MKKKKQYADWFYKIPEMYRELMPKKAQLDARDLAASFVWRDSKISNNLDYSNDFWHAIYLCIINKNDW